MQQMARAAMGFSAARCLSRTLICAAPRQRIDGHLDRPEKMPYWSSSGITNNKRSGPFATMRSLAHLNLPTDCTTRLHGSPGSSGRIPVKLEEQSDCREIAMNALQLVPKFLQSCILVAVLQPMPLQAQQNSPTSKASPQHLTERDGQHDFDFEIGTWETHLSRLVHPLTGSTSWVQLNDTSVIRKVWNGRANL